MTTMDYLSTSRIAVGLTMDPLPVRSPRCGDKYGEVQPAELVDWFIGIIQRRRGAQQVIARATDDAAGSGVYAPLRTPCERVRCPHRSHPPVSVSAGETGPSVSPH